MTKFITKFDTTSDFAAFSATTDFGRPHVSLTADDSKIHYFGDAYNEPEYVDLGLPSGLKWATCNVGASSPEQAGLYFAWGETTGYTAKQVTSGVRKFTMDVYDTGPAASISSDITLEQDAAHANLGGNWRMPNQNEYRELFNNCNAMWTTNYNGTGVKGRVFMSNVNGNSVFFPASGSADDRRMSNVGKTGCYWSSSKIGGTNNYQLFFNSSIQNISSSSGWYGFSVRGVFK